MALEAPEKAVAAPTILRPANDRLSGRERQVLILVWRRWSRGMQTTHDDINRWLGIAQGTSAEVIMGRPKDGKVGLIARGWLASPYHPNTGYRVNGKLRPGPRFGGLQGSTIYEVES